MKLASHCTSHLFTSDEEQMLARAFRALSNPHRLAIYLRLLRHADSQPANTPGSELIHSCSLQALIDKLDIGAPTISHHVKELVNAGLISVEREGKYIRCTLDEAMRQQLAAALGQRTA